MKESKMKEDAQGTQINYSKASATTNEKAMYTYRNKYRRQSSRSGASLLRNDRVDSRGTQLPGTTAVLPDTTNKQAPLQKSKMSNCRGGSYCLCSAEYIVLLFTHEP